MFKVALLVKTGVVMWWSEDVPAMAPKTFTGLPEASVAQAMESGEVINLRPSEQVGAEPLYDFEMPTQGPRQRVRCAAIPPEDFTVAADTVSLRDTSYCAMRARPRAQDLLARGVSEDIVDTLSGYTVSDEEMEQARDTVNERDVFSGNGAISQLRIVETIEHYVKLVVDGEYRIYRVETGNNEQVLIESEEVDAIPFAAITPFIVTHRFYGESVADRALEIQRIKTALTRMALDAGYFALNQRNEVSEQQMSSRTISDLLRNEPGAPVISKTGNAVRPITSGGLNFDPFQSLEYFSTVLESRTGVVRNAQGLNPDTLHDTAKGAEALRAAAQKRVRMIARVFAETGIKDLFLGIHALLRQTGGYSEKVRLRNQWVQTDPTQWGERNDMVIEVGVGSAGKEQDLLNMRQVMSMQAEAVAVQGGELTGPLVTAQHLFNSASRFSEKAGIKKPTEFFGDPSQAPAKANGPDPAAIAAQQQAQAQQAADQAKMQLEAMKLQQAQQAQQATYDLERQRLELEAARLQLDAEDRQHRREMEEAAFTLKAQAEHEDRQTDAALKLAEINAKYQTSIDVATIKADAEALRVQGDLAIQASEHQHGREIAEGSDHIADVIDDAGLHQDDAE
jgi:hypothetical protein